MELTLNGLLVDPTFYLVPGAEHCSALVVFGGNVHNIGDRVAFIEKTPRVFNGKEWIEGPKGSGGNFDTEFHIYGHYPPSQEWVLRYLKEAGVVFKESILDEKIFSSILEIISGPTFSDFMIVADSVRQYNDICATVDDSRENISVCPYCNSEEYSTDDQSYGDIDYEVCFCKSCGSFFVDPGNINEIGKNNRDLIEYAIANKKDFDNILKFLKYTIKICDITEKPHILYQIFENYFENIVVKHFDKNDVYLSFDGRSFSHIKQIIDSSNLKPTLFI